MFSSYDPDVIIMPLDGLVDAERESYIDLTSALAEPEDSFALRGIVEVKPEPEHSAAEREPLKRKRSKEDQEDEYRPHKKVKSEFPLEKLQSEKVVSKRKQRINELQEKISSGEFSGEELKKLKGSLRKAHNAEYAERARAKRTALFEEYRSKVETLELEVRELKAEKTQLIVENMELRDKLEGHLDSEPSDLQAPSYGQTDLPTTPRQWTDYQPSSPVKVNIYNSSVTLFGGYGSKPSFPSMPSYEDAMRTDFDPFS